MPSGTMSIRRPPYLPTCSPVLALAPPQGATLVASLMQSKCIHLHTLKLVKCRLVPSSMEIIMDALDVSLHCLRRSLGGR